MPKIVNFRKATAFSEKQRARAATTILIGQLLRRASMFDPVGKWSINVHFKTETEAQEFQRLAGLLTGENTIRRSQPFAGLPEHLHPSSGIDS